MSHPENLEDVFDRAKRDFHNVKKPAISPEPYVYAAACTFHGPISQVGRTNGHTKIGTGLPCCPVCGSVLLQVENQEEWDSLIANYAKTRNDPEYPKFMAWFGALRPCRPVRNQADFDARRAEFNALPKA